MPDLPDDFQTAPLAEVDPAIAEVLRRELHRQQNTLEMIASENFVPQAVLDAAGSVLTNKYAEGYPGRRYYGGCEEVDVAEQLAIDRAMELFGAEHANVQPHAGAQANNAAYMAMLEPGRHDHGHGPRPRRAPDPRDEAERLGQALQGRRLPRAPRGLSATWRRSSGWPTSTGPKVIVAGWSAYPRHLDFAAFREIADSVGARLMVDMAHFAGLVAAGEHPSPVPYADVTTTTIHKTLGGPRSGMILCSEELAKDIDRSVFPGPAGRAADAHHRRQGRGPRDRRSPSPSGPASARRSPTPGHSPTS